MMASWLCIAKTVNVQAKQKARFTAVSDGVWASEHLHVADSLKIMEVLGNIPRALLAESKLVPLPAGGQ